MKDCRQFQRMLEAHAQLYGGATQSYPVPVAIAHGAPPPPPLHTVAPPIIVGQQLQQQQPQQLQIQQTNPANGSDQYPQARGSLAMIQKGRPSNRCQKLITRQVNMAVRNPPATPEYLKWSKTPITFDRMDHPP